MSELSDDYFDDEEENLELEVEVEVEEAEEEHDEAKILLEEIKSIGPSSPEFKKKISDYMKNNPEHRKKATEILLANHCNTGMLGKHHSEEWKKNMSETMSGRVYTEEHRQNISVGRKKMLAEQGGFTVEHREKISKATIRQYQNGFNPNLHHITGLHKSSKVPNGFVFFRSSYEKKAFMLLDDDNSVDSYKSEAIIVEYVKPDDNIVSNFIVDILVTYIDGSQKWIEVNKNTTTAYTYNDAYIQFLAEQVLTGVYTWDDLTEAEVDQVQTLIGGRRG